MVTFRRAAWEEEDDGQEEGWTCGGRHSENGGGSGQDEATGQRQAMSTTMTMPLIFEMRMMPIGQHQLRPWQSACAGIMVASVRVVFLVRLLWMDPTRTPPSGHRGNGRGRIASLGGGAMTKMKLKNDDDDEANPMTTITTTPETRMIVCVVDNGNCQIVNCQLYH